MTEYPLSLKEFKISLSEKDKEEIIGDQFSTGSSPIANVIRELTGEKCYVLSKYIIYNGFRIDNPDWVNTFNKIIGRVATNYYKITVEECLKALRKIEDETY